jgi:thiol:disulfide interchange protein DsbA
MMFERVFAVMLLLSFCGYVRESPATDNPKTNVTSAIDEDKLASKGWKRDVHFAVIEPPQSVEAESGEVEIAEMFSYGCPHCYVFEPQLVLWEKAQSGGVHVVRVPVIFGRSQRIHARLYYTLQALNRGDLHPAVYDTIHRHGNKLVASTDEEALRLSVQFAKAYGIDEDQFTRAYNSEIVTKNMERAERLTRSYKIESIPAVVVNGIYKSDAQRAGGQERLIALMQDLAKQLSR